MTCCAHNLQQSHQASDEGALLEQLYLASWNFNSLEIDIALVRPELVSLVSREVLKSRVQHNIGAEAPVFP